VLGFLAIFWASFLIGFSGALVPGPTLTVTIREAGRRGARAGPLIVLGHGITEIAITVALILGVSSFMGDIRVRKVIAIVGGAFLAWMGVSMLRKLRSIEQEMAVGDKREIGSHTTPILLGITTTLSNPYWFGWWGSIGATLLVASSSVGSKGVIAFVTGHISSDLVWYSLVSYFVSLGLSYSKGTWYRITFGVCGAFLLVVGAMFIRYGLRLAGTL
jgi:threonine/homoserine/homoserine lactone efflux protein